MYSLYLVSLYSSMGALASTLSVSTILSCYPYKADVAGISSASIFPHISYKPAQDPGRVALLSTSYKRIGRFILLNGCILSRRIYKSKLPTNMKGMETFH